MPSEPVIPELSDEALSNLVGFFDTLIRMDQADKEGGDTFENKGN